MKRGINVLFLYPNTFGMNMLPPAIAVFSALLKKNGHKVQVFDTTYYAVDYGIDSDGSKEDNLRVVPFKEEMKKRNMRILWWKIFLLTLNHILFIKKMHQPLQKNDM